MAHASDAPAQLVDADPLAPMFGSVLAGLRAARLGVSEGVFVLPIDTPVPGYKVWDNLALEGSPSVPTHDGKHGHPVFLPAQWLIDFTEKLDKGMIDPATARLDQLIAPKAVYVEVDDPVVCLNLNTIADFDLYLKSAGLVT